MKKLYLYPALFIIILISSCSSSQNFAQSYTPESQDITYQQFYDGLSPYGNWVDYQNYGYVWVPDEQGFRPYYSNGHWVYTNFGWTWVSNYNWGWAPFHYGRWLYDDAYGWMWVPGYEWAPAWVSWRNGSDCYGWAPMGPGMNYDINAGYQIPVNYWAFVPRRYINSPRINNYYINREKNNTIINNTTFINNTNLTINKTVYVTGPATTEVEKATNEKIRPVKIIQRNTPGNAEVSGSTLSVYKPAVKQTPQQNEQVKPGKIANLNELKIRRENAGPAKNEIPLKEVQGNAVPATNSQPAINSQKINNSPSVNEKVDREIKKENPIIEKQAQVQQPQKIIPEQQPPVPKPENINGEKNNNPPVQNNTINKQPDNIINKQPPVINNQPAKVRVITPPDRNSGNVPQNISPAPVNRQPAKIQQINTVRPQRIPSSDKQINRTPVDRSPIIRNQNPAEQPRGIRQVPQKERN